MALLKNIQIQSYGRNLIIAYVHLSATGIDGNLSQTGKVNAGCFQHFTVIAYPASDVWKYLYRMYGLQAF